MNNYRRFYLRPRPAWWLAGLLLAALACQTLTGGSTPLAELTPTTAPAATAAPTVIPTPAPPTATPLPVPETLELNGANLLQEPADGPGYTITLTMQYLGTGSDGPPVAGQVTGQGWRVLEPAGLSLALEATGSADFILDKSLTIFQEEDQGYLVTGSGSCLSDSLGGMSGALTLFMATSRILRGEAHLVEAGVMVNGLLADRYAFDESNINFYDPTAGEITEVEEGWLAVAREGGYVLRVVIDGRGSSALLSGSAVMEGDLYYELNFIPSSQPLPAVTIPAICRPEGTAGPT